ncbi:hypothetical protein BDV25DRAFT_161317 [Aspergillus avenaceus]|uniref:Uncharacterized protein n=1 Tax=Aspergillus avenaceus TaxID=36643 RepID=A0A5N6TKX1_ASPAV|nr:hypothetical protein BDV25DRAFT_161317 [Aspergillus avenaceus]
MQIYTIEDIHAAGSDSRWPVSLWHSIFPPSLVVFVLLHVAWEPTLCRIQSCYFIFYFLFYFIFFSFLCFFSSFSFPFAVTLYIFCIIVQWPNELTFIILEIFLIKMLPFLPFSI